MVGFMSDTRPTAPWRFRPPTEDDAKAITALYLRVDHADLGRPDTDEDDVTAVWRWPDFDLDRDAVLVTGEDGGPVGYAWAHQGREGDLTVDPAFRGKGIGRALLSWLVARAADQASALVPASTMGAKQLEVHALSTNQAAAHLLAAFGFEQDRISLLMGIDLTAAEPEPAWPEGVTLRAFDAERDGRALHALISHAFEDVEGWSPRPFEEWVQFTLRRSTFDPSLVFLAESGGEPVGATLNFDFEGDGYVQYLAVARSWRGKGLGLTLLRHTFAAFAARGVARVELNVDAHNSTGATRLYERAGMHEVHRWNRWSRRHAPAVPAGGHGR
jgi:mycothiol synthase